jgi:hypothetical protein
LKNATSIKQEFPEPPLPAGKRAGEWLSWSQVDYGCAIAGYTKLSVSEDFALRARIDDMIAKGLVQEWKHASYLRAPVSLRYLWDI